MSSQTEIYLTRYFKVAPLSLSIWRAVEAKHLSRVNLKRPLLDIGCGFGEFAGVFFNSHVEMGVDIDYENLVEAMKGKKYLSLSRADARNLPFADGSFSSVISISTLEHIRGVEKAIKEAYRVLKPGGIIAITVLTDKIADCLFYGPLLRRIGFAKLGSLYTDLYNKVFKHHTVLEKKEWEKQIARVGFKIEESREIISPTITRLFDVFLITALPSQVLKKAFGRRVIFRPRFVLTFLTRIFIKYVEEEEDEGSNLFIVARKPKR